MSKQKKGRTADDDDERSLRMLTPLVALLSIAMVVFSIVAGSGRVVQQTEADPYLTMQMMVLATPDVCVVGEQQFVDLDGLPLQSLPIGYVPPAPDSICLELSATEVVRVAETSFELEVGFAEGSASVEPEVCAEIRQTLAELANEYETSMLEVGVTVPVTVDFLRNCKESNVQLQG